ncbi:MAG TPA: hypothetical protein DD670_20230 [Planctomycetaceae bacterium]|nr:hypothetical protein [Planctomycetaceae bacterium]
MTVGAGSSGTTDADGRYILQTAAEPPSDGAVPGGHLVRFSTRDMKAGKMLTLPPSCSDGSMSFVVPPEGTDQANFDLR